MCDSYWEAVRCEDSCRGNAQANEGFLTPIPKFLQDLLPCSEDNPDPYENTLTTTGCLRAKACAS